jgi:hypothetical protein
MKSSPPPLNAIKAPILFDLDPRIHEYVYLSMMLLHTQTPLKMKVAVIKRKKRKESKEKSKEGAKKTKKHVKSK